MSTHSSSRTGWLLLSAGLAAVAASIGWSAWVLLSSPDLGAPEVAGIIGLPVGIVAVVVPTALGWLNDRHVDLVESARDLARKVCMRDGRERIRLLGDDTVPIDIEFSFTPTPGRDAGGAAMRGTLTDVLAYYKRLKPQRMVITGRAGAGKTVLAIDLALALLASRTDGDPVPVPVSLPGWDADTEFTRWLASLVANTYQLSPRTARTLVDAGLVLPILDGLDELDSDDGATGAAVRPRAAALLSLLNAYRTSGQSGAVVVTSLDLAYNALVTAGADRLLDAARIEIQPVTPDQAAEYLLRRTRDQGRWQPVYDHLLFHADSVLATALSTPWHLNLAFTVYESRADPAELLGYTEAEALHADLLARYVSGAVKLTPWLGEADVPPIKDERRARKDEQRAVKVQRWLRTLAVLLSQHTDLADSNDQAADVKAMNGTDILPHLLWPAAGMRKVRVVHAILGLVTLTVAFFTVYALLGDSQPLVAPAVSPETQRSILRTIVSVVLFFAVLLIVGWLGWGYRWSRPHIGTQPHSQLRPRAIAGWLWHAVQSRSYGHGFFYGTQVIAYSIRGKSVAEARTLVRRRQDQARWSAGAPMGSPMDPLRAYPKYILAFVVFVATLMSLTIMVAALVVVGVANPSIVRGAPAAAVLTEFLKIWMYLGVLGLAIGIVWLSATPWSRYMVGVALAAFKRRSQLPPRLGRFLEWACKAGLLRQAGATYQFRHHELQEWLLLYGK